MQFFLNPNIAYLIIVITTLLIFSAVVTPGTGVLEILAFGFLLASGALIFSIEFNPWALLLIVLSAVPFVLAIYRRGKADWLLLLSIALLTIGSIFLFPTPSGGVAVNPLLAIVTSVLADSFLWIVVNKSIQAHRAKAQNLLEDVIGQIGEARTTIHSDGSVMVSGELWSARSNDEIDPGSKIRVKGRDGFVLIVEKAPDS